MSNLYIVQLDNGIDGARPFLAVAKSERGARVVASKYNPACYIRGVEEAFLIRDDFGQVCVNAHDLLVNFPVCNRARYSPDEIVNMVGIA